MKFMKNQLLLAFGALSWVLNFTVADQQKCDKDNKCPESAPCCSQYGVCGNGTTCLGGCDPRYSYRMDACMPMPIMRDLETQFGDKDILQKQEKYLGNATEYDWLYTGHVDTHDDALLLQMPPKSTASVISSTKYLWYGKISAALKSSRGDGVITAFILYSDIKDEIDYEFVGNDLKKPQTNYYWQGILNYTNAKGVDTPNTFDDYHLYEIDWHEDHIDWFVDHKKLRTLNKNETYNSTTKKYHYPQTPSRIQFSLWPAGDSSSKGTQEWAGGKVDWDSEDIKKTGYYYAFLKNISVTPYGLPLHLQVYTNNTDSYNKSAKYDAFQFNSTDGLSSDIYLSNKKTYLGKENANGLHPDNKDKKSSSSLASASALKSSASSSSKTSGSGSKGNSNSGSKGEGGKGSSGSSGGNSGGSGFSQGGKDSSSSSTSKSSSTPFSANIPSISFALSFLCLSYLVIFP